MKKIVVVPSRVMMSNGPLVSSRVVVAWVKNLNIAAVSLNGGVGIEQRLHALDEREVAGLVRCGGVGWQVDHLADKL